MGVWIETHSVSIYVAITFVTPYVGVWIETPELVEYGLNVLSLLMWECGLKQAVLVCLVCEIFVTPYVGVWIET